MCITRFPARLSNTIIYAAEVQKAGEVVHVIGYQNKAKSPGPNAMLLPIPAAGSLGPSNVVDTQKFKKVIDAYGKAIQRLEPPRLGERSFKSSDRITRSAKSFQVFESGSYTIALANDPSSVRAALEQVPAKKQIDISDTFLEGLGKLYKDWPIAVCCFDGNLDAPEPLLWWFEPRFNRVLFAPAIDAHDGYPPDPAVMVDRDHTVAFASYRSTRPNDPVLVDAIAAQVPVEHQWMFLPSVIGTKIKHRTGNGDFSLPISAICDERVPAWLDKLDITPPPKDLPTVYEHILAGGAFA